MLPLLFTPMLLSAQTVRGRLTEATAAQPIAGAMVVLLDGSGRSVEGSLTGADGAYEIRAPAPGRYRLRAQRVGYQSAVLTHFDLAGGETLVRDIVASTEAVMLEGLTVGATNPCDVRPAAGRATARLWEEVRKALEAASFTERDSLYQYTVRTHSRKLDPRSFRVLAESASTRNVYRVAPFASVSVEQLLDGGFVDQTFSGITYYAPDAEVLLSEKFLDEYCFEIAESRTNPEVVGLAFRPVSAHGAPAVRGTLWLDRATRKLRRLEYGYIRLRLPGGAAAFASGRVEFEALPTGAWIVRRWHIRMPTQVTLQREMTGSPVSITSTCGPGCYRMETQVLEDLQRVPGMIPVVTGLQEEGGEVLVTIPLRGPALPTRVMGLAAAARPVAVHPAPHRPATSSIPAAKVR